jgi:hypothetical protein
MAQHRECCAQSLQATQGTKNWHEIEAENEFNAYFFCFADLLALNRSTIGVVSMGGAP